MAEVSVPVDWLQEGRCGPLCARHGEVTTRSWKRTMLTPTPPWMYLLLLAGVLVFVVVVASTRRRERGRLPACDRCRVERRAWVAVVLTGWAVVVATFVVAVQRDRAGLAAVAVLLAVLALVATAAGDLVRVRADLGPDPLWVRLRGVHPAFADGVRSALGPAHAVPGQRVSALLGPNVLPGRPG